MTIIITANANSNYEYTHEQEHIEKETNFLAVQRNNRETF